MYRANSGIKLYFHYIRQQTLWSTRYKEIRIVLYGSGYRNISNGMLHGNPLRNPIIWNKPIYRPFGLFCV